MKTHRNPPPQSHLDNLQEKVRKAKEEECLLSQHLDDENHALKKQAGCEQRCTHMVTQRCCAATVEECVLADSEALQLNAAYGR